MQTDPSSLPSWNVKNNNKKHLIPLERAAAVCLRHYRGSSWWMLCWWCDEASYTLYSSDVFLLVSEHQLCIKLHIRSLTVLCTYCIMKCPTSCLSICPSLSTLNSKHFETQVQSDGSPPLLPSRLCLASVWKCLHCMFVDLFFSSSYCYPHITICIQGVFKK